MSAEEGAAQPPTGGPDKAPAAKPAAFTSSFIQKNTTGKKFAPKAARRRPGAAAPAAKPAAPEPTPPAVEAQSTPPAPESSSAEGTAPAQLPTPAATQEPTTQPVPAPTPSVPEAALTADVPSAPQDPTPPATEPLPTPASSNNETQSEGDQPTVPPVSQPAEIATAAQDDGDMGRAAKRRRMEPPPPKSTVVTEPAVDISVTESTQPAQPEVEAQVHVQLQQDTPSLSRVEEAVEAPESGAQSADTDTAQPPAENAAAPAPRRRRVLPWAAVNRPQEVEEEDGASAPAKKPRQPPKPRARKKAAAATETDDGGGQEEGEEGESQPVRKRPSAKARGKRKAGAADLDDGAEVPTPAKRTRKPRKPRGQDGPNNEGEEGVEAGMGEEEPAEGVEPAARRKPRQPRRKKKTAAEGEVEDGQDPAQPKKKGRPPREPTPSDAEDHEIDPEITFMDSIASRNIRVGKLSVREKAMREIDWVAVRQRRREEDARPISTKEAREKAEKELLEQAPQSDGPRFQMIDGQIQLLHSSTMVDREADADREIENYEVVEERDLTTRITSRSFLKNNKRFPNDFILPGQGKRWTKDLTDLFYEGLEHFGTDFQMISHMFPGSTRRSIKLKFTREERDDPQRVRDALHGSSTIDTHWDSFMQVSTMGEQQFADADAVKREMAEHEAVMREKINAAKAEAKERETQQKLAGVFDEAEDPNNKENGKTKKKRKGKDKQVTFQEEAGVEILENDDPAWGLE